MPDQTDNHGFSVNYEDGEDWDYNPEFTDLEQKVIVRDTDANRSNYTPHSEAFFYATDTEVWHIGDGSQWNEIGSLAGDEGFASDPHGNEAHDPDFATQTWVEDSATAADAAKFNDLSFDTVTGNARHHKLTSGSSTEYFKVCDLKDKSAGSAGSGGVEINIKFAEDRSQSPIRKLTLTAYASGSSYNAEFQDDGEYVSSGGIDFVITEDTGDGTDIDHQYHVYVRAKTYISTIVASKPGNWFGAHDWVTGLSGTDLTGSIVYDTDNLTPDRMIRAGDVYSNGSIVATQSWATGGNIAHSDLGSISSDDHHSKYTDSDAETAINNDADHGSTASHDYFSGSHVDLTNVSSNDHHSRYTDSEARTAVEGDVNLSDMSSGSASSNNVPISNGSGDVSWNYLAHGNLSGVSSSDHHTRYSNSEAVDAVESQTSISVNINGDADTVDGYDIQKNGSDGTGIINFKT